jgi:hypothetical protein
MRRIPAEKERSTIPREATPLAKKTLPMRPPGWGAEEFEEMAKPVKVPASSRTMTADAALPKAVWRVTLRTVAEDTNGGGPASFPIAARTLRALFLWHRLTIVPASISSLNSWDGTLAA